MFLRVQVEESVVAGKLLLASMRRLRPAWHYELKDLLDMEMVGTMAKPHDNHGAQLQLITCRTTADCQECIGYGYWCQQFVGHTWVAEQPLPACPSCS